MSTHVDDITCVGTSDGIAAAEKTLSNKFKMTVQRNPAVITGVQIERDRPNKRIKLHMEGYIDTLLEQYGKQDCKPADTPMDPGTAKAFMLLPVDSPDPIYIQKFTN